MDTLGYNEKVCENAAYFRAQKADIQQPQSISQEVKRMPTFNQLVRKGRQTSVKKSTAPALQKGFNSLPVSYTHLDVYKRQHTIRWVSFC